MAKRILNNEEFALFKKVLESTQEGLRLSLETFLGSIYEDRVVVTDDYIIAFGDIPVGLVAHMDTVHSTPVKQLYYDREENVMWSPQGLGADDRAGVYGMVEILKRNLRPTLILTTDEEKGGLGASKLIGDIKECPCELNFLIELDRRGSDDCVFYDCDNRDFETYIEGFGFKTSWGSFSDISYIAPAWGLAATNLSIGYEDEHSKIETLNIDWMFNTIDKVCDILEKVRPEDKFVYIESPSAFKFGSTGGFYYGGHHDFSTAYGYDSITQYSKREDGELCWGCLENFDENMLITTEDGGAYCGDCYAEKYTTCLDCGKDFRDTTRTHLKCEACRGDDV